MDELSSESSRENITGLCRTRLTKELPFPYLTPVAFSIHSCQKCLAYLKIFNSTESAKVFNSSQFVPSEDDELLNQFCQTNGIDERNCSRWKQCCKNSIACCTEQLIASLIIDPVDKYNVFCPRTWDGFSCVVPTPTNTSSPISCPDFLFDGNLGASTSKFCTENGQWNIDWKNRENTNYMICEEEVERWDYQLMLVKAACELVSVLMLSISIFLFLYCRKLYRRPRLSAKYKIHTYTFMAMLMYSLSCLLGETVFYLVPSGFPDHFNLKTFPSSCAVISMLTRFSMNFSYSAMSVEAFFLHWNVAFALGERGKLPPFRLMAVGFIIPILINAVYIALRLAGAGPAETGNCWIYPFGSYEWIINSFNIFCLVLNVVLLVNLFRIIFTMEVEDIPDLHTRRQAALFKIIKRADFRAMITFAFIFGAPQILTIFSPPFKGLLYKLYLIIANSVQMLQGAIASVVLCFLSTEVQQAWKATAVGELFRRASRARQHQRERATKELLPTACQETETVDVMAS